MPLPRTIALSVTDAALIVIGGPSIKFTGKLAKFERTLFGAFVEHMLGNRSMHLTLRARSSLGRNFGYVRPVDLTAGTYDVYFEAGGTRAALGSIAHELTHVLQYLRGDLTVEDDTFTWKGDPTISVSDYNRLPFPKYARLPWEKEAIKAQKTIPAAFLASKLQSLKGLDPSLDYIIENDLLA